MNIQEYLSRINHSGYTQPGLGVLKELQRNHLLSVPFENLDIHYRKPIELEIAKLHNKIVTEQRGGFCYELNGLFQYLLNKLGFKSKIISAQVYDSKKGKFGEEFDHLSIIVELNDKEYLVDVGFGEFTFNPLVIEPKIIQYDPRGNFMIEIANDSYVVSKIRDDLKKIQYKFTKKGRTLNDFQKICDHHQTNPDSHFRQKKLISRPTSSGRITITGNTLKITKDDKVQKKIVFPKEKYAEYLYEFFKIDELKLITRNQ